MHGEVMDTTDEISSVDTSVTNSVYPVRCTEEVLQPLFTDESLQATMGSKPPPASCKAPPALPELRLVLLGRKGAGKSAAGNTILGGVGGFESGKPTEECVKRRADVGGRKVTVVDTPGWEWYYPLNRTPNWVRRETLRSVSLCPPGPHAVLLAVRSCASVTDDYIREMEEHLEPLGGGGGVWEHTMVLFTRGDELGLGTMEQRILTSGPALQRLLQMCGNRYHVVNNLNKGDGQQVEELIRKLEDMMEGKKDGNSHLEMDSRVLLGLEADGKRRARERRKKQRQMEAQMQRGTIKAALMNDGPQGSELDAHRSFSKAPRRLPEVRLVLLGERETGKSSAGNTILGRSGFFQVGSVTEECVRRQEEVAMRLVTVVDTPGWEAGVAGGTPERVKREIVCSVASCPPGPHALLLTLRMDTLVRAEHVKEHLELLGEGVWRHTILLFTHRDQLRDGVDVEQHIQGGGRDLQWLLDKCRGRYHVISNVDGAGRGGEAARTVTELLEKVEKMATTNRCEAFSCLVQEVRDLSCQRKEKFNQQLKVIGDKMLRQEAEMKKMREREMKSIRWFFDRKKKVKSPGKAAIQREEEEDEDRGMGGRTNDISELEERIQWLTEDKEKEIQDLSLENERVHAALNQSRRERDEAMLNLEIKERVIEELKERSDEQQVKLLDLERASVKDEHERKQRGDAIRAQAETIEMLMKEKAKWVEKHNSLKVEMDRTKMHYDESLERKTQEKNKQMAEMEEKLKRQMEIKQIEMEEMGKKTLEEKQIIINNLKQREKYIEHECEEMKSQHEKEMEGKIQQIKDIKLQHQDEMARTISEIQERMEVQQQEKMEEKLKERADVVEQIRQQHDDEVRDIKQEKQRQIKELKEQFAKKNEEHVRAKRSEIAALEQKYAAQMQEQKVEYEKDKEKIHLKHKKEMEQQMEEKEKEIGALKEHQQKETALRVDEMVKLIEENNAKIKQKEDELQRIHREYADKLRDMERERQKEIERHSQEGERLMEELEERFVAQIKEINLENLKEKQMLENNQEKYILQTDHLREELKCQLENVNKDRENEKERYVKVMEEKEKEIEHLKLSIKEMMQQKEEEEKDHLKTEQQLKEREIEIEDIRFKGEEMTEKLQQKEIEGLNYRKYMEQKLEEREKEVEVLREHFKECEQEMVHAVAEKDRVTEKLKQHIKDTDEILQRNEERAEMISKQKTEAEQQREREMTEMKRVLNDVTTRLKEKEAEVIIIKEQVESKEARWREDEKKKDEKGDDEVNKLRQIIDENIKVATEAQRLLAQRDGEIEEAKTSCLNYLKEIDELKDSCENQKREIEERHMEQVREKDAEMMGILREKENEVDRLKQRETENEKELVQLRLTIEQTKSELKELTAKMEKEMTSLIREYEKEITLKNEDIESIMKDKDATIRRLGADSQRKVKELEERNEKMRKEMENLKIKYEVLKEEREKEVQKCGKQVKSLNDIQNLLEERDLELKAVKEANDKLQAEVERMREQMEKESEQRTRDEEIKKTLFIRNRDVEEREGAVCRNEDELNKRGCDLNAKQEELLRKELMLEGKDQELRKLETSLEIRQKEMEKKEKYEQDAALRAQNIEKMERELESLLKALEGKQKELSSHGQDLQMKVKGLRDQGKELKDRECHLKNEEQELLTWKSELQMQNEHVTSTTQQLDEMGRDLVLLKEELNSKERNLKTLFKKLSKWEQGLKEREEKLCTRSDLVNGDDRRDDGVDDVDCFDLTAAIETSGDDLPSLYQEVRGRRAEGRGKESDREERAEAREDQRVETASSAAGSHKCHLETLKETQALEEKEDVRGKEARREKVREEAESAAVISNFQLLSQSHTSSDNKGSDMRVVVLGETWSPRSPGGVAILGGEASEHGGSTFRSWRGEIAGRRLAVAEPLGLRWRDGPGPRNAPGRRGVLDSASWCHPGPHVVLLLLPTFLTCTQKLRRAVEEDVGLLGEEAWRRTLVVFTWGGILGGSAEQHILRNGELTGLIERSGGRYHLLTSKRNKSAIKDLLEKMEDIVALNPL